MWMWLWPWFWLAGNGQILLREAQMSDSRRMADIHADSFAIGWDKGEIEAMMGGNHVADVMVSRALIGDIVTGFAISRIIVDEAELLTIALDPEVRGRGLSAELLRRHAARARRAGAERLFLEVAADNAPALALYKGLGFVEIGRRKGYYAAADGNRNARRDALTMRWDLSGFDPTPRAYA